LVIHCHAGTYNDFRHYSAFFQIGRNACGYLFYVCHTHGYPGSDDCYRGPIFKMVTFGLPAFCHLFLSVKKAGQGWCWTTFLSNCL